MVLLKVLHSSSNSSSKLSIICIYRLHIIGTQSSSGSLSNVSMSLPHSLISSNGTTATFLTNSADISSWAATLPAGTKVWDDQKLYKQKTFNQVKCKIITITKKLMPMTLNQKRYLCFNWSDNLVVNQFVRSIEQVVSKYVLTAMTTSILYHVLDSTWTMKKLY